MQFAEYDMARIQAEEKLGLVPLKIGVWDSERSRSMASALPSRILQAVVDDEVILPRNSHWVPEWVEICENELLERILLKSDKCL